VYAAAAPNSLSFSNDDGSTLTYASKYSTTAGIATSEKLVAKDVTMGAKLTWTSSVNATNPLLKSTVVNYVVDSDPKVTTDDVKFDLTDTNSATGGVYKYAYSTGAGITQTYDSTTSTAGVVTVKNFSHQNTKSKSSIALSGSIDGATQAQSITAAKIDNENFTIVIDAFAPADLTGLLADSSLTKVAGDGTTSVAFNLSTFTDSVRVAATDADQVVTLKKIIVNGFEGGSGKDKITGSKFADVINGGAGDDTISSGDGNDTITVVSGEGSDKIDGGAGTDTAVLQGTGWTFTKVGNDLIALQAASSITTTDEDGNTIGTTATPQQRVTLTNVEKVKYNNGTEEVTKTVDGALKSTVAGDTALSSVLNQTVGLGGTLNAARVLVADKETDYSAYDWSNKDIYAIDTAGSNTVNYTSTEASGKFTSTSTGVDKSGSFKNSGSYDLVVKSGADEGDTLSAKYSSALSNVIGSYAGNDVLNKQSYVYSGTLNSFDAANNIKSSFSGSLKFNASNAYSSVVDADTGVDVQVVSSTQSSSGNNTASVVDESLGSLSASRSLNFSQISKSIGGESTDSTNSTNGSYSYSFESADKATAVKFKFSGNSDALDTSKNISTWSEATLKNADISISLNAKLTIAKETDLTNVVATETDLTAAADLVVDLQSDILRGDNTIKISGQNYSTTVNAGLGNDTVVGSDGNNSIAGGKGTNTLTGGVGDDTFIFRKSDYVSTSAKNLTGIKITTIKDFDSVVEGDKISLEGFSSSEFATDKTLAAAQAANDEATIIFESGTKTLWFDQDGASGTDYKAVKIASIVGTSDKYSWTSVTTTDETGPVAVTETIVTPDVVAA
jgi:hypothetical protein